MTRAYSEHADDAVRVLLQRLIDRVPPPQYRQAMTDLGDALGRVVAASLDPSASAFMICTNDDADFLARGVLTTLQTRPGPVALACFWNERKKVTSDKAPMVDAAPIVRRYVEPSGPVDAFVVVKSVISSACVVRTNVTELVYDLTPKQIFVVSPVMFEGARAGLEAEFPAEIAARFSYVWFAQDDERKEDGEVVPGVGGSVYELLGIGDAQTKNRYSAELVRQRRAMLGAV